MKQQIQQKKEITFELLSLEKVLITGTFFAFTEEVKQAIKTVGGVWYNNSEYKGWVIAKNNYDELYQSFKDTLLDTETKRIPWFCFALLREFKNELTFYSLEKKQITIKYSLGDQMKDINNDIPQFLLSKLYGYQKECVQEGIKQLGRILIADEMGVGKTVQSIALARVYKEAWPLLIICPSSLRLNWGDEIRHWLTDVDPKQIQVISKSKQVIQQNSIIIIISYDLCSKYKQQLEEKRFQIAIVDEAHYLKTISSQRSQICVPFLKQCKHVILLTGTPAFAKPRDLFNIITIIRPDVFTNFRDFGFRYCDPKMSRFTQGFEYEGASNLKELHFLLKHNLMIRRLKKDVLNQLPQKRRQKIRLQCDKNVTKQIQGLLTRLSRQQVDEMSDNIQDNQDGKEDISKSDSVLMLCYQLTGKAKVKAINDYIDDLIENEIKFIFFAHHYDVLDQVESHCQLKKVNTIRIDGNVPHEQRHRNVHLFQERPEIKVAILSLTAASTGITLTASSTIVFGEVYSFINIFVQQMHWTPAIMLQAEDRAHRIGQESNVDCIYLIGQDTVDDILYQKLEKKFGTVSTMIDGKNEQFGTIEEKQIEIVTSKSKNTFVQGKENNPEISNYIKQPFNNLSPIKKLNDELEVEELFKFISEEVQKSRAKDKMMIEENENSVPHPSNINYLPPPIQQELPPTNNPSKPKLVFDPKLKFQRIKFQPQTFVQMNQIDQIDKICQKRIQQTKQTSHKPNIIQSKSELKIPNFLDNKVQQIPFQNCDDDCLEEPFLEFLKSTLHNVTDSKPNQRLPDKKMIFSKQKEGMVNFNDMYESAQKRITESRKKL